MYLYMHTVNKHNNISDRRDMSDTRPKHLVVSYISLLSDILFYIQPLKMELTQGSETSANYNLTPGKYPKEYI